MGNYTLSDKHSARRIDGKADVERPGKEAGNEKGLRAHDAPSALTVLLRYFKPT